VQIDQLQAGAAGEGPLGEYPDNPVFQIASANGSRVFFTDEERLTGDAGSVAHKPDLYEFDVETGDLVDLTKPRGGESANVQGLVVGASEDGDSVYFVANGVLSQQAAEPGHAAPGQCITEAEGTPPPGAICNLYVDHDVNGEWEEPHYVATLSAEDVPDWQAPASQGAAADLGDVTSRVSSDGRYLAFMSDRRLTGYDNRATAPGADNAPAEEVFLYDSSSDGIVCASCDPSGARPRGVLDPPGGQETGPEGIGLLVDRPKIWEGSWLAGSVPGWTKVQHIRALYQSRYLSDSGRLFFDSPDALVPDDVNGKEDVYEYEPPGVPSGVHECTADGATFQPRAQGCVGLVSSGTSTHESAFLDASESGGEGGQADGGGDVFFVTAEKLVPQDTDTSFDVYDAHECTAVSPCIVPEQSAPPPVCETTDACRPPAKPAPSPSPGTISTEGTSASDNVTPPSPAPSPTPKAASNGFKSADKPRTLTRAQKLSRALKVCRKLKKKRQRAACEAQARKRYGPVEKKQAKHASRSTGRVAR
jgi:hypothetical protein